MADREKLIEVLKGYRADPPCDTCEHPIGYCDRCGLDRLADFLIANGVTIHPLTDCKQPVTDNNVGGKWIPVAERLPEEEGWYLVYTTPNREHKSINKAMFCKGYAWGNFEPYWRGAGGHWANVTHWTPLPTPPKGE